MEKCHIKRKSKNTEDPSLIKYKRHQSSVENKNN